MNNRLLVVVATLGGVLALSGCRTPSRPRATNIVFILADDLGYGDVRALAPSSRIPTPRLDRLAGAG